MSDDIIRTVRMAHRTLIVVLTTGLMFLSSPNPSVAPYEQALVEIQQIRRLASAEARYQAEYRQMLNDVIQTEVDQWTEALNQKGFTFATKDNRASDVLLIDFHSPPWNGTIAELLNWFRTDFRYAPTTVRLGDPHVKSNFFGTAFADILTSIQPRIQHSEFKVRFWRLMDRESASSANMESRSTTLDETTEVALSFRSHPDSNMSNSDFRAAQLGTMRSSDSWEKKYGDSVARFERWAEYHNLLSAVRPGEQWIPACRSLWPEVSGEILESAERKLQEEIETRSLKFQLLGISISSRSLAICLPVFSIAMLLFMWAHLRTLPQQPDGAKIAWLGLYDDFLSRCLMVCTVAILPVVTCTWAILRFAGLTWFTLVLSAAVAFFVAPVVHCFPYAPADKTQPAGGSAGKLSG